MSKYIYSMYNVFMEYVENSVIMYTNMNTYKIFLICLDSIDVCIILFIYQLNIY